jgi:hypothetical protein
VVECKRGHGWADCLIRVSGRSSSSVRPKEEADLAG